MGSEAGNGAFSATVLRGSLRTARLAADTSPAMSAGLALLAVISAGLQTASILLTGAFVGEVPAVVREGFDSSPGRRMVTELIVVCVLFLARQVVSPFQAALAESLGRKVDGALRGRMMAAASTPVTIAHLEDPALQNNVALTQGIGPGQWTPGDAALGVADNLSIRLTALAAAAVVASYRWWLGAAFVLSGFLLRSRLIVEGSKRLRVLLGETEALRRSDYVRDLALTPAAAKEVRVFGLTTWLRESFSTLWLDVMRQLWRQRRREAGAVLAFFVPLAATMGLTLVLAGRDVINGDIDLTQLVIVAQAVLAASGWTVTNSDLLIEYGAAGIEPAVAVGASADGRPESRGTRNAADLPRNGITFEGVSFRYPGRDSDVFSSFDLHIPAGTSIAIVGDNGAGKTTLVKLLTRLHVPDSGRVVVDGTDLAEFEPSSWRRRIAVIFQDFVRYELPARDNVGFGAVDKSGDDALVEAAARRAGALAVIEGLPDGWNTTLSRQYAGGTDISGGEWQRIALARALMAVEAGAGILILDEPTANLDVRSEAAIFDQFIELTRGLTTVLISHRFSSVRRADLIFVIENGRVVEQGSHDELMARGTTYATTFELQAQRFRDEGETDA